MAVSRTGRRRVAPPVMMASRRSSSGKQFVVFLPHPELHGPFAHFQHRIIDQYDSVIDDHARQGNDADAR